MHGHSELTGIALVVLAALGCGLLFERLRQPAVLGYILAGIILGHPYFELVQNTGLVNALANLGVLMLLFLIGMELRLKDFKAVWHISLLCTALQVGGSLILMWGVGSFFNWSTEFTILLAFAVSLSSTAVAVKMLESIDELGTPQGRFTLAILIGQDLAIVPMILIIRNMHAGFSFEIFGKILLSVVILASLIWYLGRKTAMRIPFSKLVSGHQDLLPLAGLVVCFGMASFSGLIGLSAAYGAFLGGLILGNTAERKDMIRSMHPIQSVLLMVFFLSVGLMMDLNFIWQNLLTVTVLLFVLTIGKTFLNISILRFIGRPWPEAFLVSLVLSQIGEFAFMLANMGVEENILNGYGYKMIIVLTSLSLAISPLWLEAARRLHAYAPGKLQNFRQYMSVVYEPEIRLFGALRRGCVRIFIWVKTKRALRASRKKQDD
ncbi:MAG: cation:proton antiporter [Alphaproteobacteria bacterium]|nr:cation:proton antiporter [Alphaproteobacteria bacterium]